jgi:MoaA/NifB/PqqE/SkfB family radical SAM enzyme
MVTKKQKVQIEGHKLMYHVSEASRWLNGEIVAPVYVEIGITNSCNHKCIFCALDYLKNKRASIDKTVLIATLKDMAEFGVKSIMFGGEGEPLLYPSLPEVIEKAKKFGIDVAITTNGVLFNKEKAELILKDLSWIKFSIDAGTNESYAKIHNCGETDFDRVLENLKVCSNYKKENNLDCTIGCQMLLIPDNVKEVEELILKIKDLGVDYLVLKPYSQHPNSINRMALDINEYDSMLTLLSKKYSKEDFQVIYRNISAQEIENKEIDYEKCYGINFFALIDALGNVIPCNIFYEKKDQHYGNIYENTFREIWNSNKRKDVLKKIHAEGCSKCRKGCRLNFVNKYLDILKNKNLEHINFI